MPSIWTWLTSPASFEADTGASPNTMTPPQSPLMVAFKFGLTKTPTAMSSGINSSAVDVKMMGASSVPSATSLPSRATTSDDAFAPVPGSPLMMVPGSIVSVAPFVTAIRPESCQTRSAVHTVFSVMFVRTTTLSFGAGVGSSMVESLVHAANVLTAITLKMSVLKRIPDRFGLHHKRPARTDGRR